jgi:hypothetical protein
MSDFIFNTQFDASFVEVLFKSSANCLGFVVEKVALVTGISPEYFGFPVSIIPTKLHI